MLGGGGVRDKGVLLVKWTVLRVEGGGMPSKYLSTLLNERSMDSDI